mmetsp:Transcript_2219/g.3609  ORF Transcript_2219/g.3609 Transcript_2219/m.3609 type:complete len:710 (+) Transcript_2219:57-2186(+)|eukprot:CAMPEP_0197024216 /NCGR_PEP_ID=MMETSP1384-20130603/4823_1 /TAXON_ID=29189 /ORGANISM="Ammonia sp." /LENGTH=709 /DNA_ID=CAMNT_0042452565 /DNA_START=46 /DNA_END=2175 /DNA_ORIENTATION=+
MASLQSETSGGAEEKKDGEAEGVRLGVHCTQDNRVKVSVIPPALPKMTSRLPVVVCCVVDVSSSMESEAVIKDANGKTESHGLSVLDLVKHSVKTIVNCLTHDDFVSIVSYSGKAEVVTALTRMDKKGKDSTLQKLDNLRANGSTNLWDGLYNGLEVLRKNEHIKCSVANSAVLLFTDGMPNIIPPKGHQAMLEKYIDTNQELPCVINTYGFGYSLDTPLLNDLAIKGNGTFAFIPDSSFVGTIFVNSISNLCCNMAKNCLVKVETNHDKYEVEVVGGYDYLQTSWGVQINLGCIMYEQNKDVVLKFTAKQPGNNDNNDNNTTEDEGKEGQNDAAGNGAMYEIDVNSLNFMSLRSQQLVQKAADCIDDDKDTNDKATEMHYYRLKACDVLRECMNSMKLNEMNEAQTSLKDLIKEIQAKKELAKEKFVKDLLADLTGQAFEAISKKEYFNKWGKHYLPSLIFAHLQQYNNNFKDPGVQNYGGKLFSDLRDRANDIFIKLPPPTPSKPKYSYNYGYGNNNINNTTKTKAAAPRKVDMSAYYNVSGGCFHGDCNVLMADNSLKAVKDVCVNDVLAGGAAVRCVVKHRCEGNKILLCNVNGLLITQYHPIVIDDEWVFPVDVDESHGQLYAAEYVYNFVLSDGHVMVVNGVKACTLGHNFKGNVIEHAYFGTGRVVSDLQKCNGWEAGMVTLGQNSFKRNMEDNSVCGLHVE